MTSRSAPDAGPLTFLDDADLAAALAETLADAEGFRLFTAAELDGPFDAAEWPDASPHDVQYWKPESLGEALFNYWD